jgi:hypothetical protein
MSFVHPLLLGGLVLVGIPVLIHLLLQQKPRRLPFPAFRFLLQKQRTNQRSLRLRHLLLLALRIAIIAALCLALARPRLVGDRLVTAFSGDRPVSAVLVIDTSSSMEYTVAGKTRLDEARRRALELLDEMPGGSRVAVLDSGEAGGEWGPSLALARDRVAGLTLRHANAPLTRQIEQAYRLFQELDREQESAAEPLPRLLYVFSDRTYGCWDAAAKSLQQPEDVAAVFIDVGQEDAANLAVAEVRPEQTTVWPGETVRVNVTVQAAGADYDSTVFFYVDGKLSVERPVKLQAGRSEVILFEQLTAAPGGNGPSAAGLGEGFHQLEVRLGNNDALPFDNAGFATFRVIPGRRVLVLADHPEKDRPEWYHVLKEAFRPDLKPAAADNVKSEYQVVCLVQVARPSTELWKKLKEFVADGRGLVVVPGGEGWRPSTTHYATGLAQGLLPGQLPPSATDAPEGHGYWHELERETQRLAGHPLLAPFDRWRRADDVSFIREEAWKPRARRFWKVKPEGDGSDVVVRYTDEEKSPAVLERRVGKGRVLLLTTPFEQPGDARDGPWNNYFGTNTFGFVFAHLAVGYLAGDSDDAGLNHVAGQAVTVRLPERPFVPRYTLKGPGLTGSDADLPRLPDQKELRIAHAATPGNYEVLYLDPAKAQPVPLRLTAFSIGPRPDEYRLDRVPAEAIESLLGAGSVLPVGRTASLQERLQERWVQPLELAPALMILLLLALAVENLLANRFYRRAPESDGGTA